MQVAKNATISGLIKKIAIESAVISLVLVLLLGIAWWIGDFSTSAKQKVDQVNGEVSAKTGELQTLKAKMAQFTEAVPLRESLKDASGKVSLDLSRDKASAIFLELKDAYFLKDMKVTIAPIVKIEAPEFVKPNMRVISSDIGITMKAYSDEQVVRFLDDATKKLSGAVKVKRFAMSRGSSKTQVENYKKPEVNFNEPMIDVKIDLVWYGIEDVDPSANAATPAAGAPTGGISTMPSGMAMPPPAGGER